MNNFSDVIDIELVFDLDLGDICGLNFFEVIGIGISIFLFFSSGFGGCLFLLVTGGQCSCSTLSLSAFLSFYEFALNTLLIGLFNIFLFFFFFNSLLSIGCFIIVLSTLQPVDKLLQQSSHLLAGIGVCQLRVTIKFNLPCMPRNEKLI